MSLNDLSVTQTKLLDWADDEYSESSLMPNVFEGPEDIRTVVEYYVENGKKFKITKKIKKMVVKEKDNPAIEERKNWKKFGVEKGRGPGPDPSTTSIGENIVLKFQLGWSKNVYKGFEEDQSVNKTTKDTFKDKKVACRLCKGDHFTARCPYKDTLQPFDEVNNAANLNISNKSVMPSESSAETTGRYIVPHLRVGRSAGGDSMFRRDKDEYFTVRVTNVSEDAREEDIRELFERFGRISRLYLAKDKETGRGKGFAFISYYDRMDAAKAIEKMDKYGYDNLIIRCEFSKSRD
ncbi:hypothetical protein T552_01926 [Pneumocystis carinii B80]|uniref:Eukaryotic translation initiation factor 3 subunit G n=1 Tax=Pneumocystis carinii (strain B80) TaxID=1408658 RepID=A0A0W4ZI58_PNEC8|nr:hypothetical protein T552_01926 [Pneumocystis carinii B80]KTW28064.1 hypothetical protein T552_01926 [Pneumocystis carinii B80]